LEVEDFQEFRIFRFDNFITRAGVGDCRWDRAAAATADAEEEVEEGGGVMDTLKSLLPISKDDPPPPSPGAGQGKGGPKLVEGEYFSGWFGEGEDEKDAWIPSLSRKERILIFVGMSAFSVLCFALVSVGVGVGDRSERST
jgi:hypothetical protein